MVFAVITGGGTAGHVLPALGIAEALQDAGHPATSIYYVGAQRGIETDLVPRSPYPHTFLDVVGFQRSLSRRNLGFAPKLVKATRQALKLLRRLRPNVVVSVGGYASMPAVLAAKRLRIPVVVVSFDRRPGWASVVSSRFAAACAVAFEGSVLPRAEVTGAPVRRTIRHVDRSGGRDAARRALGIPADRFLLTVIGGSLGSGVLNAAVVRYVGEHADDADLAVYHVVGERFRDGITGRDGRDGAWHTVVGFEDRMDLLWAATDLRVGRGGASTVAEIATTGTPSILVPWAGSAGDHQTMNVRWLSDVAAAVLLPESDVARLGAEIDDLRAHPVRLKAMNGRAWLLGERNRSTALPALIERVAATGGLRPPDPHRRPARWRSRGRDRPGNGS
jgi:UDP-N-acetylglucosamine--N-acetylmuramyl-(pentapeptide) pyrophosphoryl-undecaprenol N-acetylglucosamine transferase